MRVAFTVFCVPPKPKTNQSGLCRVLFCFLVVVGVCVGIRQSEAAIDALLRAEGIDAQSPQIPYARATILARLGRVEEARKAAHRALDLRPDYRDAASLLESLER